MADCSPSVSQQSSEMNLLNSKHAYDITFSRDNQSILDNQADARAWQELKLTGARDAQTLKYLATVAEIQANATAEQTGQTENEQTVTPVRTATGDAIVGGIGVSAEQVAANVANLATSLIPVIATALAAALGQTVAALVPVVVNAAGGASTPSQTTSKPTATTAG